MVGNKQILLNLPVALHKKLTVLAKQQSTSVTKLVILLLETCIDHVPKGEK